MSSKEALEHICNTCNNKSCPYIHYEKSRCVWYGIIKQDLDRLKKLEKVIEILKNKLDIEIYEIHENGVTEYYLDCSAGEVIDEQEEYELIKEVLLNER